MLRTSLRFGLNRLPGGRLFLGGVGFIMGIVPGGIVHAADVATNELLCSTSNGIPVIRPVKPQAAGTVRMIEKLQQIRAHVIETTDPANDVYLNAQRVTWAQQNFAAETNNAEKVLWGFQLAQEYLNIGRTEDALQQIQASEDIINASGRLPNREIQGRVRMLKAAAMLRLGEQQNCMNMHNAESCLFPLSPAAYHKLPRGSQGAIVALTEQLKEFPQDLSARWLINLAYMTLGEYPDKVPAEWLIPPKTFQSDCAFPHFTDIAGPLGVNVNGLAGGCVLDDFDNDGLIDIVCSSWGFDGVMHYFHNDGNGHFSDRTVEAGLQGMMGGENIQHTDYNNDGLLDIWVLRGSWNGKAGRVPPSLLRNNGDGTFTDVTEEAGLAAGHPSQTSVWFDYDGDGWLDLFVGNETTDPRHPDPCELYHNNHDGTFTECAAACGLRIKRFAKGVVSLDYDNDGRPDLYISCFEGRNLLFHNDGPDASGQWKFSDVTRHAGLEASNSYPTFAFDYDNDGWEDIFVDNYYARNVGDVAADYLGLPTQGTKALLYHNNHDGTFTDVTKKMHLDHVYLAMGCNFGDLDNDGWLDFYLGTGDPSLTTLMPKKMYRNNEGKDFQDVTTAGGFGHLQKGHGIGFADFLNNGNQDVYEVMGGAYAGDTSFNVLYLNPGNTNRWLKLKLEGTKSNRAGVGARINVTVQTPGGPRHIYRTVTSGGSFGSNPFRQEIGLGNATKIESVEINWPASGIRQKLTGLDLDHFYNVREGDSTAVAVELKTVHLDMKAIAAQNAMPMKMAMPGMPGMQ